MLQKAARRFLKRGGCAELVKAPGSLFHSQAHPLLPSALLEGRLHNALIGGMEFSGSPNYRVPTSD